MTVSTPSQQITAAATVDAVRMEYTGINSGPINWRCPSGHTYAGAAKSNRFADVFPEDVEFLERTGRWKRVARPVAKIVSAPQPAPAATQPPAENYSGDDLPAVNEKDEPIPAAKRRSKKAATA